MAKEISAGIIIYRQTIDGLKFLILYHGRDYWNFPKGKIEHAKSAPSPKSFGNANAPMRITKESSFQAAVREIKEETGLNRADLKFANNFKAHERFSFWRRVGEKNAKIFKIVIFYLAETKKREIKISEEHGGYGWFTYKEAMKILGKHKESQRILTQANDFLRQTQDKFLHGQSFSRPKNAERKTGG
ncbi:NUDIX domain-containing protein [Candidatus Wolfebacteria bacterium]|nr:NUDIX domain-containing protein [Candidatus Wolfebacteria bacterium]